MPTTGIAQELFTALSAGLVLAAPPLLVALVVGLILGILQAATQIQDQAMPQLIKIIVILGVCIMFGATLAAPLYQHSLSLFASFHARTR